LKFSTAWLSSACQADAVVQTEVVASSQTLQTAVVLCFDLAVVMLDSPIASNREIGLKVTNFLGAIIYQGQCGTSKCTSGRTSPDNCLNGGTPRAEGLGCDCPAGYYGYDCSVHAPESNTLSTQLIIAISCASVGLVAVIAGVTVMKRRRMRAQRMARQSSAPLQPSGIPLNPMGRSDSSKALLKAASGSNLSTPRMGSFSGTGLSAPMAIPPLPGLRRSDSSQALMARGNVNVKRSNSNMSLRDDSSETPVIPARHDSSRQVGSSSGPQVPVRGSSMRPKRDD
jgi:hypothetical protein